MARYAPVAARLLALSTRCDCPCARARLTQRWRYAPRFRYDTYDFAPGQFRFYVPQLTNFLLNGRYGGAAKLEVFLLDKSERSTHFAHRVYWFLRSFAPNVPYSSEIAGMMALASPGEQATLLRAVEHQGAAAAERMVHALDAICGPGERWQHNRGLMGADLAGGEPGAAESKGGEGADAGAGGDGVSPSAELAAAASAAVAGAVEATATGGAGEDAGSETKAGGEAESKGEVAEHEDKSEGVAGTVIEPYPEAVRARAATTVAPGPFHEVLGMCDEFEQISKDIDATALEMRNDYLRSQLQRLDELYMPSRALYVPVGNPHNVVLGVHPEESFCFKTKERAPFLICFEVVEYATADGRSLAASGGAGGFAQHQYGAVDAASTSVASGRSRRGRRRRRLGRKAKGKKIRVGGFSVGIGDSKINVPHKSFRIPAPFLSSSDDSEADGAEMTSRNPLGLTGSSTFSTITDDGERPMGMWSSPARPSEEDRVRQIHTRRLHRKRTKREQRRKKQAETGAVRSSGAAEPHLSRHDSYDAGLESGASDGSGGDEASGEDDGIASPDPGSPIRQSSGVAFPPDHGVATPERDATASDGRSHGRIAVPPADATPGTNYAAMPRTPEVGTVGRGADADSERPPDTGGSHRPGDDVTGYAAVALVSPAGGSTTAGADSAPRVGRAGGGEAGSGSDDSWGKQEDVGQLDGTPRASRRGRGGAAVARARSISASSADSHSEGGERDRPRITSVTDEELEAEIAAGLSEHDIDRRVSDVEESAMHRIDAAHANETRRSSLQELTTPLVSASGSSTGAAGDAGMEAPRSAVSEVIFKERWEEKERRIRAKSRYSHLPGWRLVPIIYKSNDDLRQEQFASQLIAQFAAIFRAADLPLWLRPYDILATSPTSGFIEAIPDTVSIHSLKEKDPAYTTLEDFFVRHFGRGDPDSARLTAARRNFVASLAAYSIVCYVLQIKDRHNGNILIDAEGHVVHIDFGFILSNSPGGGANFERAPFKLINEFVEVMGGNRSDLFRRYRTLCVRAFLEVRKHVDRILLLVEMVISGNDALPCFAGGYDRVIHGLRERLFLDVSSRACVGIVHRLIDESLNNWRTRWYDKYQRCCVGIL